MNMSGCRIALFEGRTVARTLIRESRARARFFNAELFGDPVWDMLLQLYEAEESRHVCATKDLLADRRVSAGTRERWVKVLEKHGLVTIVAEGGEHQHGLIKLTRTGHMAMEDYLSALSQHDPERF